MNKLGGWWRIWIVASVVALIYCLYVPLSSADLMGEGAGSGACMPGTVVTGYRQAYERIKNPNYKGPPKAPTLDEMLDPKSAINAPSDPLEKYLREKEAGNPTEQFITTARQFPTFSCVSWGSVGIGVAFAALISLSLIVFALVFGWVVKGFRN